LVGFEAPFEPFARGILIHDLKDKNGIKFKLEKKMSRFISALAFLALLFPASRLLAVEVCLVNDSDRTAIITVISGSERFEKRIKPKSHAFVLIADTKDDRVVIAQSVDESSPDQVTSSTKVVDTKVLTEHVNRLNFCYVHGTEADGLRMDLLAFVCLDIVPHQWGREPLEHERFPHVKSELIQSLKSTTEVDPLSSGSLRKFVRFFSLGEQSDAFKLPVAP
jgi:hypothetical protein